MVEKPQTLSDKIEMKKCPNCKIKHFDYIKARDVKEFIKKLKEELTKQGRMVCSCYKTRNAVIDALAGDKLTGGEK